MNVGRVLGGPGTAALSVTVGVAPMAADAAAVAAANASVKVGLGLGAVVRLTLELGRRGYVDGGWGMSAALCVLS